MSYPYLSDVIRALTGYDIPLPLAMFGLMVACAMLVAASALKAELCRMYDSKQLGKARRQVTLKDGTVAIVEMPPQDIVPDFTIFVMIAGIAGARLFHILEHTDSFRAAPWEMIFSTSGLSVFGGLIFGAMAGVIFIKRWKLPAKNLLDATAPALMLGYAIGRIGCQISGDGDWGRAANFVFKPDWLPTWFWAQTYTNNIFGVVIPAPGVYPTPIYETAMALACFALLWAVRKHPFKKGWLFAVYLLLVGLERLLIEQIRVNRKLDFFGFSATQAEIIAIALIIAGFVGLSMLTHRSRTLPQRKNPLPQRL